MKAFVPQVTQPWSGSQRSQRRVLRCPIPVRTMRPRTPKKRVRTTVTICATSRDVPNRKQDRSLNVAVLVSGSGRSLENLCEKVEDGSLSGCNMKLVISSKKTAGAIARAEKYSILAKVLRLKDFESDTEAFSEAISNSFDEIEADLVIMAGWMHFYKIPPRYDGKVINIHPSLIPAFCGQGFYGHRVHEAVVSLPSNLFSSIYPPQCLELTPLLSDKVWREDHRLYSSSSR